MTAPGARGAAAWAVVGGAVLVAAAGWLREPSVPYLVAAVAATVVTAALALRRERGQWLRLLAGAGAVLFCVAAAGPQLTLWRLEHRWTAFEARTLDGAAATLDAALARAATGAARTAEAALDASDATGRFETLAELVADGSGEERAVVVSEAGRPVAWAGTLRVDTESLDAALGVVQNPFYDVLYAARTRGTRRAVATVVLQARPPAGRFTTSLADVVVAQSAAQGVRFELTGTTRPADAHAALALSDGGWLAGRVDPVVAEEVALRTRERGRGLGLALLGLVVVGYLGALWQQGVPVRYRLAGTGAALVAGNLVPLNSLSNITALFDPSVYYAPFGGSYTASVGALGLTSALLLLTLFAVPRRTARALPPVAGGVLALVVVGSGLFLLRELARGIRAPAAGVPTSLWLAWEVALFLAATLVLVLGANAGRAVLGRRRGVPPWVAPAIAAVAALLAQPLWMAPGRWPAWYPLLWVAAMIALAFTRRTRGLVLVAGAVAAFAAMTLVWGTTVQRRVDLAQRDVQGLTQPDRGLPTLLERFAADLATGRPPTTGPELLAAYAASDLAAANYAVQLAAWAPSGERVAEVADVAGEEPTATLEAAVAEALRTGEPVLGPATTGAGVRQVLAVPGTGGWVTTAAVGARSRLFTDDPYAPLVGAAGMGDAEPPYRLTLLPASVAATGSMPDARWERRGNVLHGDWRTTADGPTLGVHVEIELRDQWALVPRGVLVLLLNLGVAGLLWAAGTLSERGARRWLRSWRGRWLRSYRARLTIALLAFFVVPAVAFGVWASRQLQSDVRQARELLVQEALRAAVRRPGGGVAAAREDRQPGEPPVLLYADGVLTESSDDVLAALAPLGRLLPADVVVDADLDAHSNASVAMPVGEETVLVGYLALDGGVVGGARAVLAIPARADELALERRRRDLGVLLAFAIAVGALAALWLSGEAARQLARPIGVLREAALAIAAGDRSPPLPAVAPPAEFVPVFSAFRRMAADLSASRAALEEAERRTADVLRHVASAVLAVDDAGRITLFNPAAARLFGRVLRPGVPLAELGLPALEQRVAELAAGTVDAAEGAEADVELTVGRHQLLARATPLRHGAAGAVLTLDDVTELARAQRVLAWGEMARQVAHEIKNPLTPIRLGVQHLRRAYQSGRGDYEAVLTQNVERILAEIDRLDEIARSFSRYGTAPAERLPGEPVDVSAVARDVVELERLGGGDGQVEWRMEGTDVPRLALARDDELREVLLNVLENARLARARAVSVRVSPAPDQRLCIIITDDGDGVPAEVLPRLFEPRFSTRTSGSGLGLAISRRLVEAWGGTMRLRSTEGRGTEVEIALAAADA